MLVWMRQLLKDFDISMEKPTPLLIDNQGAIVWGREGIRHAKHVEIRRNYVLELIRDNVVQMKYCDTAHMAADVLTKGLQRIKFERNRKMIGMEESQCEQERVLES